MVHRDPETGRYLPHDDVQFEDIELASFGFEGGATAASLEGGTSYGGADQGRVLAGQLLDYDELCDRSEELVLLEAQHRLSCWQNATATEDGSFRVYAEISTAQALELPDVAQVETAEFPPGQGGEDNLVGSVDSSDGIDLVGRPLAATAGGSFYNSANGAGGSGSSGEDSYESDYWPGETGRFHPRDELNLNLRFEASNIDDAGVHIDLVGQHLYGVVDHEH